MNELETPCSLPAPWSDRRWLWGVRLASFTSMLLICVASVEERFRGLPFTTLATWPFHLPYLLVLLLLLRGPRKSGLALAVGTGSVVLVAAVRSLAFALLETGGLPVVFSLLLALVQGQLVNSAARTYSTLRQESGDRRTLVWAVMVSTLYCSLLSAAPGLHLEFPVQVHAAPAFRNAAWAAVSIRKINSCAASYAQHHPTPGFPENLHPIGPAGTGCLEEWWVSGSRLGYSFSYTPGPAIRGGRIQTYMINARPLEYRTTGIRNLFSDQSGVIHFTRQDRPATAQDPVW